MNNRVNLFQENAESCLLTELGLLEMMQHSCMVGAFKPWLPPPPSQAPKEQNGDCFETNGPDCKVHADDWSPVFIMP